MQKKCQELKKEWIIGVNYIWNWQFIAIFGLFCSLGVRAVLWNMFSFNVILRPKQLSSHIVHFP